jgi:hypothetical protein
MTKLVMTILKNESKGLKDFFEANMPQEKGKLNKSGEINSHIKTTDWSEFQRTGNQSL